MKVSVFRSVVVMMLMGLMVPIGSTSATTVNSPTVPSNLTDAPVLDLRAVGSQLVAETIEDALRQGGLALFEEGFQFESSLNWVFGESIEGEVDAVVPLWSADGYALFAQPGVVFWTGLAEEERIDGNFGAVYRTELFDSFIGGGSVFYDYDFQYGHSRLGAGVDLQSGLFQAGFNYYHPLDEWDEGRTDYEEQALRGVDFRIALEREVMRLGANLSYWRFEGEEDEKGDWKPSYGFDAGIRIVPGVFLEGGWEGHDETVSLDQRWNAGLAFRFSLPDFKGASYGEGGLSSNLWKFVEREKRILYEERLGIPRVSFADTVYEDDDDEQVGGVAEGNTVTIPADIGKPLDEDVMLHIMIAETSTAVLGTDFTYAHRVYELNEATGAQSAPEGDATPCAEALCEVMIPAGVTRFDIEADILADNDAQEVPKSIDFQVEVPEEYAGLVRGSFVEQVTLRGHGNTVQFASAASTLNENPDTPEGSVEVSVNVELPSPVSITLNVGATDDAATAMIDRDYRISTRSLTIPANASSASLTLDGINNDVGEGSKTIELTLSGDLPDGWAFGSQTTHTVTLQDDDLAIFFANAPDTLAETESDDMHTITVRITQAPTVGTDLVVRVAAGGSEAGTTADPGNDFGLSPVDLTFNADNLSRTFDISILEDMVAEPDEFIVLTLADMGTQMARENEGFSLGGNHRITIPANDNTVAFASGTSTLTEGANTMRDVTVNVNQPAPVPITLNVDVIGTTDPKAATEGTDYENLPDSLTIGARQSSGTITLRGREDELSEGNENIMLEISVSGSLPAGWALGSQTTHTVTLQDNDLSVGFERSSGSAREGDAPHTIDVVISTAPTAGNVVLRVTNVPANSTAANPGDLTVSDTSLTFLANDSSAGNLRKTITITVVDDSVKEPDEVYRLLIADDSTTLSDTGFSLGISEYDFTIPTNDNTVSLNSSMSNSTMQEDGTANVVVSIDNTYSQDITLNASVSSSNATAGTDYTVPGTLTIDANSSTGTLTITGIDDNLEQGQQTLNVTISGTLPTGWNFIDSSGSIADPAQLTYTVTIIDNEIGIAGWASMTDTHPAGVGTYVATATLSKSPSTTIELGVILSTDSTATRNVDFFSGGGSGDCTVIRWPANAMGNDLTQTCNLNVTSGATTGETIVLELTDSANHLRDEGSFSATPSPAKITVTIE